MFRGLEAVPASGSFELLANVRPPATAFFCMVERLFGLGFEDAGGAFLGAFLGRGFEDAGGVFLGAFLGRGFEDAGEALRVVLVAASGSGLPVLVVEAGNASLRVTPSWLLLLLLPVIARERWG